MAIASTLACSFNIVNMYVAFYELLSFRFVFKDIKLWDVYEDKEKFPLPNHQITFEWFINSMRRNVDLISYFPVGCS